MNRRTSLPLLLAALPLVLLAACLTSRRSSGELKSLTVEEVDQRIAAKDGKTFVYDNNPEDVFAKGHLRSAKWVDHDHVTAADLPQDKSATLIFYCASEL